MFELQINFDGLLHYVENDVSDGRAAAVRLCVVAAKALGHDARISALKGTQIGDTGAEAIAIDGQRVILQFGKSSADPKFNFEETVNGEGLKGAVPFEEIIGDSADQNPEIVKADPPGTVRSQVLIGAGGEFGLDASGSPPKLEMPATLRRDRKAMILDIAEGFHMKVSDVNWARLVVLPLKDSVQPDAVYDIAPGQDNKALLQLSQTCVSTDRANIGDPDEDFSYQYLLLRQLPNGLRRDQMPVPIIRKFSEETKNFAQARFRTKPDGCNCAGGRALSRRYDLDRFMEIPRVESAPSAQTSAGGEGERG